LAILDGDYSRQQLRDDLAVHIRQPKVSALEAVSEPQVIEAKQVKDRSLEIVNMDAI
jgi:hypothetical protein